MAVEETTVRATVGPLLAAAGLDLEEIRINRAGAKTGVTVIVDSDAGPTLDAVAELTRELSRAIDEDPAYGQQPFTLEVTTPGAERPLTAPRHWRRSRGRRAAIELTDGTALLARIGALDPEAGTVTVVLPGERRVAPTTREVRLDDVAKAVVQVEFRPPNPLEMELSGLTAGRVAAGAEPVDPGTDPNDDDDAAVADVAEQGDED